jgi:hypothetical protein
VFSIDFLSFYHLHRTTAPPYHNGQSRKRRRRLQSHHLCAPFRCPRPATDTLTLAHAANPHTSEEAKEHAREAVEEFQSSGELPDPQEGKNLGNVIGGHKAALKYVPSSVGLCARS